MQQADATDELDAGSDFIHDGNAEAWIKTAHAVKARMLNQLSKTTDYNADAVLSEIARLIRAMQMMPKYPFLKA